MKYDQDEHYWSGSVCTLTEAIDLCEERNGVGSTVALVDLTGKGNHATMIDSSNQEQVVLSILVPYRCGGTKKFIAAISRNGGPVGTYTIIAKPNIEAMTEKQVDQALKLATDEQLSGEIKLRTPSKNRRSKKK